MRYFYSLLLGLAAFSVNAHDLELKTGRIFSSGYVERYSEIPVYTNGSGVRTLMYINNISIPVAGEIWDVEYEVHVTNDDLRARGKGVAATTEVRIGVDTSHNRSGYFACSRANGSFNVGVEAHHGLISRRCLFKWTQADIDDLNNINPVLKAYLWASSTAAQSGDKLKVDQGRGKLVLLRHIPE
ncbi:MAG: hypothetical protein ACRBHB_20100 [Arenicella sp.]